MITTNKTPYLPLFLLLALMSALMMTSCTSSSKVEMHSNVSQKTYQRLDSIRQTKEAQLVSYMQQTYDAASAIQTDAEMNRLFAAKHNLYGKILNGDNSAETGQRISDVRSEIEDRYIENYLMFHDIFLIDETGAIFFTVRRKADYHQNIFHGSLAKTSLSKTLREEPAGGFVDFEDYEIAGEPSAFFIVPKLHKGKPSGWFVFQFSINKINEMFRIDETLGHTGEVFLVNKERAMLTDSRFFAQSSVLQRHLSRENISTKFAEREGHKIVTDYRGFKAMTSFKVVSVFGSQWLLIAKIDQDEVVTEQYRENSNKYLELFENEIMALTIPPAQSSHRLQHDIEVDMDELRRVDSPGKGIYTHGVRTCTAVIFTYPGKFAYLAHISANDIIYNGEQTDLLGIIRKRITDFDLVRTQKRHLQVSIVSPTPLYKKNIVDSLTDWGILLSQIHLVFNHEARHANISHDFANNETVIEWKMHESPEATSTVVRDYPSLGDLMARKISWTEPIPAI